jgi:alpha-1,3-fucosyltransferase
MFHQREILTQINSRAPCHLHRNLDLEVDTFNLTMTYRLHSDIVWTYGETIDLSTGAVVAPNVYVQWKKVEDDFQGLN